MALGNNMKKSFKSDNSFKTQKLSGVNYNTDEKNYEITINSDVDSMKIITQKSKMIVARLLTGTLHL